MSTDTMNTRRAASGQAAVKGGGDPTTNVVDTLANIMHYCASAGVDFETCIGAAVMHFTAERA